MTVVTCAVSVTGVQDKSGLAPTVSFGTLLRQADR